MIRVQQSRSKGWRKPEGVVSVGRGTRWGNLAPGAREAQMRGDNAIAVALFEAWLTLPDQAALVADARAVLRGKTLMCWCSLDSPCHADTWARIANAEVAP